MNNAEWRRIPITFHKLIEQRHGDKKGHRGDKDDERELSQVDIEKMKPNQRDTDNYSEARDRRRRTEIESIVA